jgi:hypothetical protein
MPMEVGTPAGRSTAVKPAPDDAPDDAAVPEEDGVPEEEGELDEDGGDDDEDGDEDGDDAEEADELGLSTADAALAESYTAALAAAVVVTFVSRSAC